MGRNELLAQMAYGVVILLRVYCLDVSYALLLLMLLSAYCATADGRNATLVYIISPKAAAGVSAFNVTFTDFTAI